jgi:dephospho-CoA kinase
MGKADPGSLRLVGLTGGIGAGKSEALAAFRDSGAAILSTDEVVHELLDDEAVRARMVERWGEDVVSDGHTDRARVGELVFKHPDELAWLEGVLHPLVGERVAEWRARLRPESGVAVVEVPLLFESGMEEFFDSVVCVIADDEIRERRLAERGQAGLEGRSSRQLDQEEKAARADQVIVNDGSVEELRTRVAELMTELGEVSGVGP